MANNSPTIVSASLSDEQLRKSIDSLVSHVDESMKKMVQSTNNAVGQMEAKLKSLGNLKIDSGGSADGGASKRAKAQNAETDAVEKNVAARDKQIKKNQEAATSFDNFAKAQQVAIRSASPSGIRNADTLQTMNIQLDLLRERLREARQQYSSFVALAAHATTTGDKGLFQYATDGVHRYEQEVRSLIPQLRTLQSGIQQMGDVIAPQGHTIQNYVNSLQKANPELAQLNESFKRGKSLMQNGTTTTQQLANAQGELNTKTNQQKQTLDDMNAYIRQNIQREQERREAIRQTGLAARETADQLIRSAHEQASVQGNSPIKGIKELTVAVEQMRRAYFDMSASEKTSPVGMAIEADIKRANDAIAVIRKYNQSLLGTEQRNSNNITNTSTLSSLRESLKNLTDQYNKLTVAELNAGKGDALIQHFQDTTRAAQILQRTLNRPVSLKAALAGDERTLDDIAYKMQRLRAYRQGIDLTKPNAANEIKQVDEALARLQKDADKWMSKSQEMIKNNTALGRSWNYMKNRLAFYFTVGASTQFVKNLIEVRSQYEMNERALGILIDSAERGTQIFNELSQMALVSPYTLIELSAAAKQLTAYDVAAKDVVDTTRRLADMAAAVGIPIERLTYALGQIKAYGYLNSRDARMFANAGIPLVKQLSDYYTELEGKLVSTADVYDRIKKKSIDYNEVMEVMYKMTDQGGKFFDFQAKMADTLKVRLANLTLAWNNMLNDMGKETQGVLTWGIGALRDLFQQWKQLDNLIKNAALAVGVRTLLVALRAATVGLGAFGRTMTWNAILGKKLGSVVVGLAKSFGTLFSSRLTWFALLAIAATEAAQAIFGINEAQKALNESIRNGANDNYDNISKFLEHYKEVRESLYATQKVAIGDVYNPTTGRAEAQAYAEQRVAKDIDNSEAKKVWESVREQIELTVASSDKYIGNLLSISNMSERVRQGFNLLDDIQVVNAALKELDDDTIKVSQDFSAWWNAWQAPDGLIENLKDYQDALDDVIAEYGTMKSFRENTFIGGKGSDDLNDYETALERFRDDLQKTTDSIINFIELKGWSGDESKINQVFEQITQKLVLDNQLDPQKAFTLQTEVEEARSKAAKEALLQRINDEKAAYKISHDESVRQALNADIERYNNWNETNGRSKVEWERFTKWLKEQHISETTAMFRNMDAEDIKSLNFQEGKHAEWVTRMVTQYAKEHKMSYDEAFKYLRSWVRSANQWSIFIPLTISTEDKKSIYDQLGEYDKAVDEADAQIERLTRRINELNAKKKKSKEETQELGNAERELADAQKAKAEAEAKGGHGKKEKKDKKAANKAAKQAESELQKALKDELSIIDKVRSIYKDLTKQGMSYADAVARATDGWGETLNAINKVLKKNGLQKLDLTKFAGIENPRELVNMLQSQLDALVGRAKPTEIKELQTKIQTLKVDAEKYDLSKITSGLNWALDNVKDEYELSIELESSPELGGIFADMMGLSKEQLEQMPKDFDGVVSRLQQIIDSKLGRGKFNLIENLNKSMFDSWLKTNQHGSPEDDAISKSLKAVVDYANKVRLDETKKQTDEWNKLLEKYAEYEYKKQQIRKQYERELETARKKGANENIVAAITNRYNQENAKLDFEQFQATPQWITATGDLAGLTHKALGMLIDDLVEYKKNAKNLNPKQIKEINRALRSLYREQRKNNPFHSLSDAMDEAADRASVFQEEIDNSNKELLKLENNRSQENIADVAEKIDKLRKKIKKLNEEKDKAEKVDVSVYTEWFNSIISLASNAANSISDMMNALAGENGSGDANSIKDMFDILGNAGQWAAIGGLLGGGYGAIIGGALGAVTSVVTKFADEWSGNADITDKVKESERAVKRLEIAYVDLENAMKKAYGTSEIGAKRAIVFNKELQRQELQRQLKLEESRKAKNKDYDKILDLKKQIKELEHDIIDSINEITYSLLGITSVGSAAETLVSSMIAAFKKGERFMDEYKQSFDDMIDNMIMKSIVSNVIGQRLQDMFDRIQKTAEDRASSEKETYEKAAKDYEQWLKLADNGWIDEYYYFDPKTFKADRTKVITREEQEKLWKERLEYLLKQYENALTPTKEDVLSIRDDMNNWREGVKEEFLAFMDAFGVKYGQDSTKSLSSLQQGLQGMSEDQAGALEAYWNINTQQQFVHTDLLTQIRDTLTGFDFDVQTATMSQILLQLRSSYEIQSAIHSLLSGWSADNERAVRVELIS